MKQQQLVIAIYDLSRVAVAGLYKTTRCTLLFYIARAFSGYHGNQQPIYAGAWEETGSTDARIENVVL